MEFRVKDTWHGYGCNGRAGRKAMIARMKRAGKKRAALRDKRFEERCQ